MATITRSDLCNRVLAYLGVIAATEAASPAEQALIGEAIDACLAGLSCVMNLSSITTDAIPEWAQIPLRDYVGGAVAKMYGKAGEDFINYRDAASDAKAELLIRIPGAP